MSPFKISLFSRIGSSVLSAIGAIGAIGGAVSAIIGEYFYNFNQQTIGAFTGGDDDNRIENTSPTKPEITFGNALKFDGVNDYVSFSNIALTTTSTISFWFKANDTDWDGAFFSRGVSGGFGYRLLSSTQIRCYSAGASDFTVPTMSVGTWYHCLISIGESTSRLYLNGVQSTSGALTNRLISINQLGKYENFASVYQLNGVMDEVAIWNGTHEGTLTDAQNLYNSGNGALASDIIPSPTVYWRCNEVDGATTLVDETENYNGTLTNFNFDGTDGFVRHGYYKELSPYTGIAADFDGTASKIVSTDLMTTLKEGSNLTECGVFIRFTTPSTGSNKYIICFSDLNANAFTAVYRSTGGQLAFYGRTASTLQSSVTFSDLIDVGETHTLFLNLTSGSVASLYLDGVLQVPSGATNNPFFIDNNFDTVTLGCQNKNSTTAQFFDGSISDAIFLKRPFTESERNAILNNPEFTKTYLVDTVGITWADVAAWYPLTENVGTTAYDYSDNANHGTWTNAAYSPDGLPSIRQLGLQSFSKYTYFDGVDDYVISNFGRTDLPNGSSFSLGFWLKINSATLQTEGIFQMASQLSSAGPFILIRSLAGGLSVAYNNAVVVSGIPFATQTWKRIDITYDGTNYRLYFDGVLYSTSQTGSTQNFTGIYLGNGYSGYFGGIIDEFALWKSTLTPTQVANQYNGGNGNFANIDVEPEIWFKLDESGSDTTVVNSGLGGNSFDGTPNGGMETIILPTKEVISDIPYDVFGFECNFQNIQGTEQVLNLNVPNGYVEYDGHAGPYTDVKQIQFIIKPTSNNHAYILTDEANNRVAYINGNQVVSDFGTSSIYINDVETDIVLTDTWQQVTIEFTTPVDIEKLYIGSSAVPDAFEEFGIDKLNIVKE